MNMREEYKQVYTVTEMETGNLVMTAPLVVIADAFFLHHEGVIRIVRECQDGHGCDVYLSRGIRKDMNVVIHKA